jgi:hypothetical protein
MRRTDYDESHVIDRDARAGEHFLERPQQAAGDIGRGRNLGRGDDFDAGHHDRVGIGSPYVNTDSEHHLPRRTSVQSY